MGLYETLALEQHSALRGPADCGHGRLRALECTGRDSEPTAILTRAPAADRVAGEQRDLAWQPFRRALSRRLYIRLAQCGERTGRSDFACGYTVDAGRYSLCALAP